MEFMRKQQDTMAITENNLFSVKAQLENRLVNKFKKIYLKISIKQWYFFPKE